MKHKQELIDILMADAKIKGRYADYQGNTCAIGGIAVKFGWSGKPLKKNPMSHGWESPPNEKTITYLLSHSKNNMVKAITKAQEYFGLDYDMLKVIQRTNDKYDDTNQRHLALKELVESWEEE